VVRRWLFILAFVPNLVTGQTPAHAIVADSVREYLAREWDANAANRFQSERAYCVGYKTFRSNTYGTWLFVVLSARPADVNASGQRFVIFKPCRPGEAAIHTHTNTTCTSDTECEIGGVEAYNCEESDLDRATLVRSGMPFAGTQCDRFAISFHYSPLLKSP
jgi:hypothetical protein